MANTPQGSSDDLNELKGRNNDLDAMMDMFLDDDIDLDPDYETLEKQANPKSFPHTISSYKLELLTLDREFNASSSSLRTHFRKSEGDVLHVEVGLTDYSHKGLARSLEMVVEVREDDGNVVCEYRFTEIIDSEADSFRVDKCLDVSDLPAGNYMIYLKEDDDEVRISEMKLVNVPFPYTKYTTLSGFGLFRLNKGEGNDDLKEIANRGEHNCFDSEGFAGVLIGLCCVNELCREYYYQFIVRIYNELGVVVFEGESSNTVESKKDTDPNNLLMYQAFANNIEWKKGNYKVEVELFGEIIVLADFVVGDRDVKATYNTNSIQPKVNIAGKEILLDVKSPMEQLNAMVGLGGIKEQISKMVSKAKLDEKRKSKGLPIKPTQMHCAFLGNPGTGKTTVAKLLGQIYKDMGMLSKGHVVLEERSTLSGQNWGAEGELVNKAIQKAKGGILFIDEAYDLVTNHPNDPGKLIISTLLSALADENQRDWMLILAGYPKQMEKMLSVNPGLRSRLSKLNFEDYNQEQLMQVADFWLDKNCYAMNEDARSAFNSLISTAVSQRDEHFGNARFVFNLLENEIQPAMAVRVIAADDFDSVDVLTTIEKCDIPNLKVESESDKAISKLNEMVGLSELKSKIDKHLSFVRFVNARRDSNIATVVPPMHMIFTGNPGTGKSSVADYLGEIYKSMGLLSIGNVIKVSRADIIGNQTGDTEKNMQTLLSTARGNILFIDEAYTLFGSLDQSDFGKRAIEVLLDALSRESSDMVVVMAGYPTEMEQLLCSNPGLKGRFPYTFHFEDYSEDELLQIAKGVALKNNLILSEEAERAVVAIIKREYRIKDANFSNARMVVRLITTQVMPNMAHRVIATGNRDDLALKTILADDIPIGSREVEQINDNLFDEQAIATILKRLDGLVGLNQVKLAIHDFVEVSRKLNRQRKKFVGCYPLKWSFTGNTGTGKSTVAEILSELLKAMHLLGRGHIVEVKAEELYAVNTYQADEHLKKRMQESQQGLLFVDGDAAQFRSPDSKYNPDYLRMCLAANTATMPGTYAIVIAEHESPRHGLVKSLAQSGITDFDHTLIFGDYIAAELLDILKMQLAEYEITLNEDASQVMSNYIDSLCTKRNADYANARTMKLLARSIQKVSLLNGDCDGIITAEEVAEFAVAKFEQSKPMGYQR